MCTMDASKAFDRVNLFVEKMKCLPFVFKIFDVFLL